MVRLVSPVTSRVVNGFRPIAILVKAVLAVKLAKLILLLGKNTSVIFVKASKPVKSEIVKLGAEIIPV